MNPKIEKINQEINKHQDRIQRSQERIRELEQQRTELENTEIVGMVRGLDVAPEELAAFIKAFRSSTAGTPDFMGKKEDEENECEEAWYYHYVNESHHPEFITFSHHISDMFEDDMFEMVCDWLAMSYEFGEKDWTEFWMNNMSKKG